MQSRNEGAEGLLLFVGATYLYYLDYDIILVVIVADAKLPQPHYDSTYYARDILPSYNAF